MANSSASYAITILVAIVISTAWYRFARPKEQRKVEGFTPSNQPNRLSKALASALPGIVILPSDTLRFTQWKGSYWAQQECETVPGCIVRPRNVVQLCAAINIIRQEYQRQKQGTNSEHFARLFAIRGGGHSCVPGAASVNDGVLIDLGHFCDVIPSENRESVSIGAGNTWGRVSKILDTHGLAVPGGRNSGVGVGGLSLGGGLSFFSPKFGLVCSNILSYEIVLASGSVVTASETANHDLWRALKGGANNFGIVTRFRVRSFPCSNIWSGFLYVPSSQAAKVLAAFSACITGMAPNEQVESYDLQAAGPLVCFTYAQMLRIHIIAVNLVHTDPSGNGNNWPTFWKKSQFSNIWRLWSTCRVRPLTNATDELAALNPPGKRQALATTTIKNDLSTINATHSIHLDAISSIRRHNIRGLTWTLVLQPFSATWASKDGSDSLGLGGTSSEPLINVSFTVNWTKSQDDEVVKAATRRATEDIEAFAVANKTSHPYKYLNYCADWQKPFKSYGEKNLTSLQEVSRKYDPEGLFQNACSGAFKLFEGVKTGNNM